MRNCIGQVSIRTIYTDNGPIPLGWRCNESNNACKNHKKGGFFWHSWESGWSRAILLVCRWKAHIQRSDFTDHRVHGSARPPMGVGGMYQSKWRTTKSVPCKLLKPPCCKKWLLLFCSSGFTNGSISKYTLTLADIFEPDAWLFLNYLASFSIISGFTILI